MRDEEYGEHLNQLFERVRRGEMHELHKIVARTGEDIGKILTRERLLQIIREKTPASISELAYYGASDDVVYSFQFRNPAGFL